MVYKKQQSPNWEKFGNIVYLKGDTSLRQGFPYNQKFPKTYDPINTRFELLLVSGEKCEAVVDDSREFMSEGLEWKLKTPTELHNINNNVERHVVVAWKEK